jgi:hypothetical protein
MGTLNSIDSKFMSPLKISVFFASIDVTGWCVATAVTVRSIYSVLRVFRASRNTVVFFGSVRCTASATIQYIVTIMLCYLS